MAETVIQTPSSSDSGAAGWAVAAVVLIVVLIGAFLWFQRTTPSPQNPGTNIQVTIPNPTGNTGNTGGTGTGGGTGGGTGY